MDHTIYIYISLRNAIPPLRGVLSFQTAYDIAYTFAFKNVCHALGLLLRARPAILHICDICPHTMPRRALCVASEEHSRFISELAIYRRLCAIAIWISISSVYIRDQSRTFPLGGCDEMPTLPPRSKAQYVASNIYICIYTGPSVKRDSDAN